jgi:hypothetical protein
MSKADGKVYVISYEIQGTKFQLPYVYKTVSGVIEAVIALQNKEWYMDNIKVLVITRGRSSEDGEYSVINNVLIKVNDTTKVLYGE